ncbi:protein ENL-like [Eriocheir sinensis]|uniref:protein ENL-like n=1 Tax=Eriocheir sinensis TaxID=95602 RepID=UPI0021C5C8A2|nr:protein ENL-like [Eriocheir sinensis]
MLTRREVVVEKPFRDRRYKDHRRKVRSALPRIDTGPPVEYPHLVVKLKKLRLERDRQGKICDDNIKLVHRMAIIMRTKRLDNINKAPKGPFERRRKPVGGGGVREQRKEEERWEGGSFLQQVTSEAERHIRPPPPGRMIQHRAPAGMCRVPRVGPPPPAPPLPRRRHLVPTIMLPLSSPRSRQSPSPSTGSGRSSSHRRGRETTRLTPLPSANRRASITPSAASPQDENSSSAGDGTADLGEEYSSDEVEESEAEEEVDEEEVKEKNEVEDEEEVEDEAENEDNKEAEEEVTDSDDHVSSVLLSHHPNITIDEASDDEFYS